MLLHSTALQVKSLIRVRKIIKIVATVCQILRLKCAKLQFRLGLRADAAVFKMAYFWGKGEASVVESKKILKIDTGRRVACTDNISVEV